ncbi:MAG TPA: transglycosylase SLT domain-containing protein [Steroidobacteraceae bacterium]
MRPLTWIRSLLFLALLLHGATVPAGGEEDSAAGMRQAFMDAMAAVTVSPTAPPSGDSPALQGYVLYPYLQAARLRGQLRLVTPSSGGLSVPLLPIDDAIAAFLEAQGSRPVTQKLREEWLLSLATRSAWPTFAAQFDRDRDVQPSLRCHALAARIALGRTAGLEEDIAETWLVPRSLADACDPAIAWWKTRGGPGEELTLRRARLALGAGQPALARSLARSLPAERAAPLLQWAALIEQPAREVAALVAEPGRPVENDALLDGWMRFARTDPDAAAAMYPALVESRRLDDRGASPYALAVALGRAWSRLPGALEFFQRVHPDDFDERAHEWHARAALWAGDWPRVAKAIAAMPESLRSQARWQYWTARASDRLGDAARARAGYAALIPSDNWYAALAAARLDRKFVPTLQPLPLSDAEIQKLGADPAFVRAHELLLVDMDPDASIEWRAAYDELPPDRQVQAIGLAARWGWHHQAIATAARLKLFNDYDVLYPRPFDFDVREASRRSGLSESFIYAIIRQESLYRADAGSSAGALGLMQLLPETARATARRADLPVPTRTQLLQPAINIPLGSSYLAYLVHRFDGETALATAAYNAGPNAARRWLPPAPLDLDVWAENIPFNETRAYVQRVAWHALVFAWLDKREPQDVTAWLRSVRPADTGVADAP